MTFQPADPETAQAIREHIARMRGERQERHVARCRDCLRLLHGPPPTDAERAEAAKRLGKDIGE